MYKLDGNNQKMGTIVELILKKLTAKKKYVTKYEFNSSQIIFKLLCLKLFALLKTQQSQYVFLLILQ